MKLADFEYDLPRELIAQRPTTRRDEARMLVHSVALDTTQHRHVSDLPGLLDAGDLLVVNDTRVLPARLHARRATGGVVELLLLAPEQGRVWRAMANPARKLKPGERLSVEGARVEARLLDRPDEHWRVELVDPDGADEPVEALLERVGRMPLPPYVKRGSDEDEALDRERYQTVYATAPGAVAAPTAGLHFTSELLDALEQRGVRRASVTLHVGEGTFLPVQVDDLGDHVMHAERYVLPEQTVEAIEQTRAAGGRVVAVGTTTVRVLESCATPDGGLRPGEGETRLFLLPGSKLAVVNALLTNFHLPRSTLLMLVSAFAGRERVLRLYREAVEQRYRFYSYGDAMLLTS